MGVRHSATTLLAYALTVVASDIADVVRGAGGWLCDRVRAGWKVTVLVPDGSDMRALRVLGVQSLPLDTERHFLRNAVPTALAISGDILADDEQPQTGNRLGRLLGRTAASRRTDAISTQRRCARIQSSCLEAAALGTELCGASEDFHSCAVW